jgi:hypothetical protein
MLFPKHSAWLQCMCCLGGHLQHTCVELPLFVVTTLVTLPAGSSLPVTGSM